jgi:hypothetical protein
MSSTTITSDLNVGDDVEEVDTRVFDCLPQLHDHVVARVRGVVGVIGLGARATRGSEEERLLYGTLLAGEQLDEDAPSAPRVDGDVVLGGAEQELKQRRGEGFATFVLVVR